MTAPTSLPGLPAAARTAGTVSTSDRRGADDRAPAFASALDDALTDRTPARPTDRPGARAAERAADRALGRASDRASFQRRAEAPDDAGTDAQTPTGMPEQDTGQDTAQDASAEDTAPVAPGAPVVLPPGLWALLAAAAPLTSDTSGDATSAAAGLIGAVTGSGTGPTAAFLTGPATVPVPAVVPGPAPTPTPTTQSAAPATGEVTTPTATAPTAVSALAEAAGLSVVLDPTSTPAAAGPPAESRPTAAAAGVPVLLPTAWTADSAETGAGGSTGNSPLPTRQLPEAAADSDTDTNTDTVVSSGPAPAASAPPVPAAAATPVRGDAPVAAQLGRQLAVLRNAPDGSQTMTVVITPESLGTVTVSVTVTGGKLDLTLHGAHEAGRHALTEALPELRRDLESAGLTFDRLAVDTASRDGGTSPRSQQQVLDARTGQQGSSGQPGQQEAPSRTWGSSPDHRGEGSPAPTHESASSGVDVRV